MPSNTAVQGPVRDESRLTFSGSHLKEVWLIIIIIKFFNVA